MDINRNLDKYTEKVKNIWNEEAKKEPKLKEKLQHSSRVAKYISLLTNNNSYEFFGWIHDIGRIHQIKKIGCFNDLEYNHSNAGIDYILENDIKYLKDFKLAKDIILYHSGYNICPKQEKTEILFWLTMSDRLDNALTCKNYLIKEEIADEKGYKKYGTDGAYLTSYFINAINIKDVNIDKRYCKTYLDYFYFAYTLLLRILENKRVMQIIKSNEEIKCEVIESFCFFENLFNERVLNTELKEQIISNLIETRNKVI